MGEYVQILVVHPNGSPDLVERVTAFLIEQRLVDGPVHSGEKLQLAEGAEGWLAPDTNRQLGPLRQLGLLRLLDGEPPAGRILVHGGGNTGRDSTCPACLRAYPIVPDAMADAVASWCEGGDGALRCVHCDVASSVTAWTTRNLAFGAVAVELWYWYPVRRELAEALAAAVDARCTWVIAMF